MKDTRSRFETLYRKTHGGSLQGIETTLDARYKELFPNPIKAELYTPSSSRSDRVVLAESFTGAGWPPCAAIGMAFDAILERYSRREVAVLEYHLHIPFPDPMTNPSTEARAKLCDAQATPTYAIDGEKTIGGGAREDAKEFYDKLDLQIAKRLKKPAEARLSLEASLEGRLVKVKATVDKLVSKSPDLMLQIALVEDDLSYSGENGVRFHPMVVRSLGGPKAEGFAIAPSKVTAIEHIFDLGKITRELKAYLEDYEKEHKKGFHQKKHEINDGRLSVGAFVQDKKTKNVLQASFVELKTEAAESNR